MKSKLTSITIASTHCLSEEWLNTYYPFDLPEDWQWAYYANEFRAALLPADYWLDTSLDELENALDEVDDDFHFALRLSSTELSNYNNDVIEKRLCTFVNHAHYLLVDEAFNESSLSVPNELHAVLLNEDRLLSKHIQKNNEQIGLIRTHHWETGLANVLETLHSEITADHLLLFAEGSYDELQQLETVLHEEFCA